MDDPREILKAAGAECAEVEVWAEKVYTGEFSEMKTVPEALSIIGPLREVVVTSNVAILALARLAAKQRGMLESAYTDYEARWNPDWGSFRQHDAWFSDLEAGLCPT
ncbi:MAG TPA: hypothetical protein VIK32_12350 [Candidatus Limnocylindrales bacterium]